MNNVKENEYTRNSLTLELVAGQKIYSLQEAKQIALAFYELDSSLMKAIKSVKTKDKYTDELMVKIKKSLKTLYSLKILNNSMTSQDLLYKIKCLLAQYKSHLNEKYKSYLKKSFFSFSCQGMPIIFLLQDVCFEENNPRLHKELFEELMNYGLDLNLTGVLPGGMSRLSIAGGKTTTILLQAVASNSLYTTILLERLGCKFDALVSFEINGEVKKIMVIEAALLFSKSLFSQGIVFYLSSDMQKFLNKKLDEINTIQDRRALDLNVQTSSTLAPPGIVKI